MNIQHLLRNIIRNAEEGLPLSTCDEMDEILIAIKNDAKLILSTKWVIDDGDPYGGARKGI